MGNKTHRLEPTQFKSARIQELVVWMAKRDGEICPIEREAINLTREIGEDIAFDIGMDDLTAHLQKMRRGEGPTQYTNRKAAVVDLSIIDLEAERMARQVVDINQYRDNNGTA